MWRHMAFHMTLSLQKYLQGFDKNKGNSVLIFDNKVSDQTAFTKLLLNPPSWSDTYYKKAKKQEQLDQIVDVPHFVDSKQVGLIQLADFLCYFLRRHIEFSLALRPPKYQGEEANSFPAESSYSNVLRRCLAQPTRRMLKPNLLIAFPAGCF